jgi:hypothetical protein
LFPEVELHGFREAADLCLGTHQNGTISLSLNAWMAPPRDTSSHGQAIAVLTAGLESRAQSALVAAIGIVHDELGHGQRGPAQFSSRRKELAVPEKIGVPAPLFASQSKLTLFVASSLP